MNEEKTNIVVGPPGTGKTTTLLGVVEEALASGTKPSRIGFISFTKKAAEEGKTRASERFGIDPENLPHFRTIHSFAFRHLNMRRDQVFGWPHIRELGRMLGIDFKGRGEVEDGDTYGMNSADRLLFLEGLARNVKRPLKEIWNEAFEDEVDWWELERFAKALALFKKSRMLSDFTDLLERFCASPPHSMPELDLLIVDEAQDLSLLQWDAVEMLASKAKVIHTAGDDDQAIYRWSGADVEKFINLPGSSKILDVSYRIPNSVHKLADSISRQITKRRPKTWFPRAEVGSVNWFSSIGEVDLSSGTWLLLARNGYMLDELEDSCLSQGFSFTSVNRDPLKSPALEAIRIWENLRRGKEESSEKVLEAFKFLPTYLTSAVLVKKLKADESDRMYAMPELRQLGLRTDEIWHKALAKISDKERDFFIAARKRGEPLLKAPRIRISTIHSVKGGQADHVLLMSDMSHRTFLNYQSNPDDELRVWYVASTRCRISLNIIMPRTNLSFEF
jgi:DNA helicase-2/ATP-dependent DNA helicase PcrA